MIVYEANKSWLRDVRHLSVSYTMKRIMQHTLVMGAITAVIAFLTLDVLQLPPWKIDSSVFSLLGIVLSILLVFRTNSAYDRWWEGRQLWGRLVNDSRNLAVMVHAALPEEDLDTRRFLAVHLANFGYTLKEHLRKGVQLEDLIFLSPEEHQLYGSKAHLPSFMAWQIQHRIQQSFRNGDIAGEDHLNLKVHTQALLEVTGACERIKKTPIPFSYNVYLKLYIMVYTGILPFGLIPHFGYFAILFVMFIAFAFLGVQLMAEEIEDPFGLDCNDLPTGDIAHTIKKNVFEILEVRHVENEPEKNLYQKVF
ncbi:bestrophin family protein [Rufibacter aurantiacus]|uniref:bestrophin family protein n=1 Tax=Rufibacter aurantiacus TaxID=2817374 RepID=UPI001B30C618|nr:bestrophin family ion channel [Rufibacter aurantiacus]